jgi:hypothetical protein
VQLSDTVPGSDEAQAAADREELLQRRLWALGGQAIDTEPVESAPRLYIETLNEMIDAQGVRVAALSNQVPVAVFMLELLGAALALALALLASYLAILGRGVPAVALASLLVSFLLLVIADLDRPTRGMIRVPDTALRNQLASMQLPPAASPRAGPSPGDQADYEVRMAAQRAGELTVPALRRLPPAPHGPSAGWERRAHAQGHCQSGQAGPPPGQLGALARQVGAASRIDVLGRRHLIHRAGNSAAAWRRSASVPSTSSTASRIIPTGFWKATTGAQRTRARKTSATAA